MYLLKNFNEIKNWSTVPVGQILAVIDYRDWLETNCMDNWYSWWVDYNFSCKSWDKNSDLIFFKNEEDKVKFILKFL